MRKRPNGSGSVYPANGTWVAALTIGGRRRTRKAKTQREANQRLNELIAERDAGGVGDDPTVQAWLDAWYASRLLDGLAPATLEADATAIRIWVVPYVGHLKLSRLKADDVRRMDRSLVAAGRSGSAVRQAHGALKRAIDEAVRQGLVMRNVASLVRMPPVASRRLPALEKTEIRAIIPVAVRRGEKARVLLQLLTGMRQGELLALDLSDVVLSGDQPHLVVSRTRARIRWTHGRTCTAASMHTSSKCPAKVRVSETGPTKTAAGARVIPLQPVLVEVLAEHRDAVLRDRLAAGSAWVGEALFPSGPLGGRRTVEHDYEIWTSILEEALGTRHGTHAARRTAITDLLATTDVHTVMAIVGHSSASVLQTYARPRLDRRASAMEAIADAYGL